VTRRKTMPDATPPPEQPPFNARAVIAGDVTDPEFGATVRWLRKLAAWYAAGEGKRYVEDEPAYLFTHSSELMGLLAHDSYTGEISGPQPGDSNYSWRRDTAREAAWQRHLHSVTRDFRRWREVCWHCSQGKPLAKAYAAAASPNDSRDAIRNAYQRIQRLLRATASN